MGLGSEEIHALLSRAPELRRNALARQAMASRRGMMIRFRRAHEAHRDARLVFRAAAAGRPLELQRRLVLGKLAGGAYVARLTLDGRRVTPIQAASLRGHTECVELLRRCVGVDFEYNDVPVSFGFGDTATTLRMQAERPTE